MNILHHLFRWLKFALHRCGADGCWRKGSPCFLETSFAMVPDDWYCHKHAHDAGYCWSCGNFWGGIESFDFRANGLCDHCDEMFKSEMGDFDRDDDQLDCTDQYNPDDP